MEFKTIHEILDFAIDNEQKAADFYYKLSNEVADLHMKKTFIEFAKEEDNHKARLIKIKDTGEFQLKDDKVIDLKIGDSIIASKISDKMTYQESLILAMKREKVAYILYMKLSEIAPDDKFKKLFKNLAIEEAKHKLKFEIEYDNIIYHEH